MFDLFLDYKSYAQSILLFATAFAAWRWGASPERASAAVLLGVLWLANLGFQAILYGAPDFASVETGALVLDTVAFVSLLGIALNANRIYPLCLTMLQGLVVLIHFAAWVATSAPLAYAILSIAPSYLLIATLAVGTWLHHRRVQRLGPYPSWRRSSANIPVKVDRRPI